MVIVGASWGLRLLLLYWVLETCHYCYPFRLMYNCWKEKFGDRKCGSNGRRAVLSLQLASWFSHFHAFVFLILFFSVACIFTHPIWLSCFFRTVCVLYHVVNLLLYILLQCMFPYSIACHLFVVFVIQNVFLSSEYIQTISPSYILMVYCIVTYLTRHVKYRNYGGFAYVLLSLPSTFSPIVLKLL